MNFDLSPNGGVEGASKPSGKVAVPDEFDVEEAELANLIDNSGVFNGTKSSPNQIIDTTEQTTELDSSNRLVTQAWQAKHVNDHPISSYSASNQQSRQQNIVNSSVDSSAHDDDEDEEGEYDDNDDELNNGWSDDDSEEDPQDPLLSLSDQELVDDEWENDEDAGYTIEAMTESEFILMEEVRSLRSALFLLHLIVSNCIALYHVDCHYECRGDS